jgi:diguanylate cyclase (GGDEF)-like protein
MPLDLRTIVVLLLVSALLMCCALALGLRALQAAGLRRWNGGLALFGAGWLLIAARGALPDAFTVAAADALLLAGLCLQVAALREFDGRPVPGWLSWAPPAALFALALVLLDRYAALTAVVSVAYATALCALAAQALRRRERHRGVCRFMAAVLIAGAAGLLARALDIALHPEANPALFAANPLHAAAFVLLFAVTVVSSFAFLVLQQGRAEAELRHLAMFDALTGVLNRRAFLDLAERDLARAAREGAPFAVLMLDIDHFKSVNDRFGHQAGDRALADFAARVKAGARPSDLVGRYGGEEFCVLLPATAPAEAQAVAERLRAAIAASPLGGLPGTVTVSIGVAACTSPGCWSLAAITERADAALYAAKGTGRNRVVAIRLAPREARAAACAPARSAPAPQCS